MEEKRVCPTHKPGKKRMAMERTDKEQASRELVEWKQRGPVWHGMIGTVLELRPQGGGARGMGARGSLMRRSYARRVTGAGFVANVTRK